MRAAYKGIAHAITACVVLQATWIALAWFTVLKDTDNGKTFTKDSDANIGHVLHSIFGMGVMPLLGLALLVVSFFVKAPGAVKFAGFTLLAIVVQVVLALLVVSFFVKAPGAVKFAGFTLLAIVVQVVLALVAFGVPAVGALHGINAFIVAGIAEATARRIGAEEVPLAAESEPASV